MASITSRLGKLLFVAWPLTACASGAPPVPRAAEVDVSRYMGDWYVIASIPSRPEKDAVNAVESYRLAPGGKIETTFRYRKENVRNDLKTIHATGYADASTKNAVWGMQFIWPIRAQYVIAWVDPDYRSVVVARDKRDYVWIMARTPTMGDAEYAQLVAKVAAMGYDVGKLRKVPQQWPEPKER
ncbi:lipocalin family protein [Luteibacter sp. 3190]|uniref:lipocalin family protein n=1 Tax=Luteibacter sp. 3190 TaxID=2817736 RepID=UPI0028648B20|nr:lipocalin family protein [Luteibacter sp. 3190]MDR6935945.1 apolipoprotein D and lipocalin family protein [Luteibacter sp. 3190]